MFREHILGKHSYVWWQALTFLRTKKAPVANEHVIFVTNSVHCITESIGWNKLSVEIRNFEN